MIRHAGFLYCRVAQLVERDSHLRSHKKNRARGGMMRETRSRRKTATQPIGDDGVTTILSMSAVLVRPRQQNIAEKPHAL